MYHGAEHKTINCIENGYELTVENVKIQSREHKRCGTSFIVYVLFFTIIFFTCIQVENVVMKIVFRLLLVPIIAGISYEFIRLAGKSNSKLMYVLSRPGMWVQRLTVKEPDDTMIEVAIRSVEEVFDWKVFVENFTQNEQPVKVEKKRRRSFLEDAPEPEDGDIDEIYEEEVEEEIAAVMNPVDKSLFNACGDIMPGFIEQEKDDVLDALDRYFESDEMK